ncbi:MAG TPA: TAXI family TRAP transporter solute-binding subunit, partial [Bacillota bacterium]|nr:TAXI family TRAP transporter solute-binding subunit [Bacillota bacterium]
MKKNVLFAAVVALVKIYWWVVLLVLIGFAVAYKFVAPPPPREITVATGSENGGYHRFGLQLKAALEKKGLTVKLRSSNGTIENLKLLSDPASGVSVAFGQGGAERFYEGDTSGIRALGSLFYEPLWFFYRKDCHLTNFASLKHLKVAIGKNGSGTQMLSKVLLRENNISEECWVPIGFDEAVKALQQNQVQALFLVAPVNDPMDRHKPHPDVYRLMADPNLALFGAPRAQAYVSRLPHLSTVTIGEGLLDLEKNYPPRTEPLISPLATLLCREDLNGDIAMLILQTCREIQSEGGWLEKAGEFPSKAGVTFPFLPEAKQFLEKGPSFFYKLLPFWVANLINRLWIMAIPLITLLLPSIKLALPTYRWRIRRKIATKYRLLMTIDDKIAAGTIAQTLEADIAQLVHYEDELAKLSVPIMFAGDFYMLRSHVRYLRQRLEEIHLQRTQGRSEVPEA